MGIKDLFKGSAEGLISGVTNGAANIISKIKADPTKVLEYEKELKELEVNANLKASELSNQIEEAYLKDTQNARDSNVHIQESDKSSWLAKNYAYLQDGFFCIVFALMLYKIIYHEVPEANKELFYTAFGTLGAIVYTTVNFHRGSSVGSKENGKALHNVVKNMK